MSRIVVLPLIFRFHFPDAKFESLLQDKASVTKPEFRSKTTRGWVSSKDSIPLDTLAEAYMYYGKRYWIYACWCGETFNANNRDWLMVSSFAFFRIILAYNPSKDRNNRGSVYKKLFQCNGS